MNKDSNIGTLIVAFCLCFVCSIVVSGAATALKERQVYNQQLDIKKNILLAGGLIESGSNSESIQKAFKRVKVDIVDLASGEKVTDIDPTTYDVKEALSDPEMSQSIPDKKDLAKIKKREKLAKVYRVVDEDGKIEQIILPIRGKGLWSTLYGFLAIEPDLTSVKGLSFYQHAETPGLGGEIDNPQWKAQFPGKILFADDGSPALTVLKGKVNPSDPMAKHQVDGLSGATITALGVANLLKYWLGEDGFGPYFNQLKSQI